MNTYQKDIAKRAARLRVDNEAITKRETLRAKREAMIASVAETVANDWYKRAVRNPVKMALYWRQPREGENAACPIIDTSAPNESFVLDSTISPAMTRLQVQALVADRMRNLPMLRMSVWYC